MEFRRKLLSCSECSFSAEITADYGDRLHSFSMDCQGDSGGNLRFRVTAPQTLDGISGTLSDTGGKLTFDDTALHFDLLADGQFSPVTAPWIFIKTLCSGYITAAWEEESFLRLSMDDSYQDNALHLDIWLEEDEPVRGEILYDGKRILTVLMKDFDMK